MAKPTNALVGHPQEKKVVDALMEGVSLRDIARWTKPPVSISAISRYRDRYIIPAMQNAAQLTAVLSGTHADPNPVQLTPYEQMRLRKKNASNVMLMTAVPASKTTVPASGPSAPRPALNFGSSLAPNTPPASREAATTPPEAATNPISSTNRDISDEECNLYETETNTDDTFDTPPPKTYTVTRLSNEAAALARQAIYAAPSLHVKENRIRAKQKRLDRLAMIVNERAESMSGCATCGRQREDHPWEDDTMPEFRRCDKFVLIPGGSSGFMAHTIKGIGGGQTVDMYEVDTGLLKAIDEGEKAISIELGQWQETTVGQVSVQIVCPAAPDVANLPRLTSKQEFTELEEDEDGIFGVLALPATGA